MQSKTLFSCFRPLTLAAVAGAALLAAPGAQATNAALTDAQKKEIQVLVEQFLMEKPEIIIKAVESYRMQQQQDMEKQAAEKIKKYMGELTAADAPSAGNPKADVVVVEFMDYNCGYCKRALPDIQNILKDDKNVRFVFKDMPVLGEASHLAAQWALAAHKQGKYFEYHSALMNHRGGKDENTLAELAEKAGLDVAKMRKDAASAEIDAALKKDIEIATDIGIQGTPAFIVGSEFFPGYLGEERLKASIAQQRKAKKAN